MISLRSVEIPATFHPFANLLLLPYMFKMG